MQFGTGLGGSVVGGLYGGSGNPASTGQAGQPAASAGPTGRQSLMAAAFGNDGGGGTTAGPLAAIVGIAAWALLIGVWWTLPK